ncbi:hypothetical protein JI735_04735 [Paenibacillus sonchi]|uniref:Uncharacterized protein n=1 Tax=Paenibacillus sonchi TaxID=373687 RepID=A0A974SE73_9BACL|nr:hypothetical protein JI735_04735 [Paenibacillus sonchi]
MENQPDSLAFFQLALAKQQVSSASWKKGTYFSPKSTIVSLKWKKGA